MSYELEILKELQAIRSALESHFLSERKRRMADDAIWHNWQKEKDFAAGELPRKLELREEITKLAKEEEARRERDRACLAGLSRRAEELRERIALRDQKLETLLPELTALLSDLEDTKR